MADFCIAFEGGVEEDAEGLACFAVVARWNTVFLSMAADGAPWSPGSPRFVSNSERTTLSVRREMWSYKE